VVDRWRRVNKEHHIGSGFIRCVANVTIIAEFVLDIFQLLVL
jgi:hypothetical protein